MNGVEAVGPPHCSGGDIQSTADMSEVLERRALRLRLDQGASTGPAASSSDAAASGPAEKPLSNIVPLSCRSSGEALSRICHARAGCSPACRAVVRRLNGTQGCRAALH